jgi:hypothetical protein
MLFPYLNWLRKLWKRVVDGEVILGRLRRGAARGRNNSGEGGPGAGPDQVGELVEEVRKQWAAGIWAG